MIIEISGISAARFKAAMQAKVADVLESLGASQDACLKVDVQDNGAIDVVLGARVEAAYLRFIGVYES
jgi:citrate lyase subunit gamma (acyl carrier protein)